jgi:NAD(P)-dependent dehydrogenase (short-subunit alcohol dehydrogenase family)
MDVDIAVVTGGAGGLGGLITRQLVGHGFCVAIADTDQIAALELEPRKAR